MSCTPVNIYGPFQQHLFLGLSVSSFTSNMDLAGNNTDVTIRLVNDPCSSVNGKRYWDETLNLSGIDTVDNVPHSPKLWYNADPGFIYPDIGSPCYFRATHLKDDSLPYNSVTNPYIGFEYCGLLQSYEELNGEDGNVWVVKLVSPNEILQGAHIILEEYAGSISSANNVFNVFGFAEKYGIAGVDCPLTTVNNTSFGSPANKFGGANITDNGMPTSHIKDAIHRLCSAVPSYSDMYSNGRLIFRGSGVDHDGFGVIAANTSVSGIPKSLYLIDMSEVVVPTTDIWRSRMSGIPSIHDFISEVCNDGGYDWYCELLPTVISGALYNIIKIRTIYRATQPVVGEISAFLESMEVSGNPVNSSQSIGVELRNEPTAALIIGGQKESLYQSVNPDGLGNYNILPYWGLYQDGNVIETFTLNFDNGEVDDDEAGTKEITDKLVTGIFVNVDQLDASLYGVFSFTEIEGKKFVFITIDEMRAALKSEESWRDWSFNVNRYIHGTINDDTGGIFGNSFVTFGYLLKDKMINSLDFSFKQIENLLVGDGAKFNVKDFIKVPKLGDDKHDLLSDETKDLKAIFNFVSEYANYYGTKFMVKMPYDPSTGESITAVKRDGDDTGELGTNTIKPSEEPCESGWPENSSSPNTELSTILGLSYPSQTYLFTNESNKITPFVCFNNLSTKDLREVNEPDTWYYSGGTLYVKADVEVGHFVYANASTFYSPRVVFSIDKPVKMRLQEEKTRENAKLIVDIIDTIAYLFGEAFVGDDAIDNLHAAADGNYLKNFPMAQKAYIPDGVVIPIKSNTINYGPWLSSPAGPPGQTRVEMVAGLVPWEYGSLARLKTAGEYTANLSITNMQLAEKGSVTVPGIPTRSLGSEINSGAAFLLESRSATSDTINLDGSSGYYYLGLDAWTGLHGPNITSVSCDIGPGGITTSYEFRTYTPKYNRFGKLTLDRFQKAGQRIVKMNRSIRLAANQSMANITRIANKKLRLKAAAAELAKDKADADKSCDASILVGKKRDYEGGGSSDAAISKINELSGDLSTDFDKKALISLDAFFRPAQKSTTLNNLPGFAQPTNGGSLKNRTKYSEPPIESYTPIEIETEFLDPFADTSVGQTVRCDGTTHHDITIIGRGDSLPDNNDFVESVNLRTAERNGANPYATNNNYRFMAIKGPLVMTGWGYDTDGKPVPNKGDIGAANGVFALENLQDKFADDFMQKPELWPVAPVDLRYDRLRGVWTTPPGLRIVRAKITGDPLSETNDSTEAQILESDSNPIYKADGTIVEPEEKTITVWLPYKSTEVTNVDIPNPYAHTDDIVIAYYNDAEGKYYAISLWHGTNDGECKKVYTNLECVSSGINAHWINIYTPLCSGSGIDNLPCTNNYSCEPFHITFELLEDIEGNDQDNCNHPGNLARIKCITNCGTTTVPSTDYVLVKNTTPLFRDAIKGCQGVAVVDYSWTGQAEPILSSTIGEDTYNIDDNFRFTITSCELPISMALCNLESTMCNTDASGILDTGTFSPIYMGNNTFVTPAPTYAKNRFGHAGAGNSLVFLVRKTNDWHIVDINKVQSDVFTDVQEGEDCTLNFSKRQVAVESCSVAGPYPVTVPIDTITFPIYISKCNTETGVLETYQTDVTVNPCAGTAVTGNWVLCTGNCGPGV